jgi:hypothetical protein
MIHPAIISGKADKIVKIFEDFFTNFDSAGYDVPGSKLNGSQVSAEIVDPGGRMRAGHRLTAYRSNPTSGSAISVPAGSRIVECVITPTSGASTIMRFAQLDSGTVLQILHNGLGGLSLQHRLVGWSVIQTVNGVFSDGVGSTVKIEMYDNSTVSVWVDDVLRIDGALFPSDFLDSTKVSSFEESPGTLTELAVFEYETSNVLAIVGSDAIDYNTELIDYSVDGSNMTNLPLGTMIVFDHEAASGTSVMGWSSIGTGGRQPYAWAFGGGTIKLNRSGASGDPDVRYDPDSPRFKLAILMMSGFECFGLWDGRNFELLFRELSQPIFFEPGGLFGGNPGFASFDGGINFYKIGMYQIPALAGGDFQHRLAQDATPNNGATQNITTGDLEFRITFNPGDPMSSQKAYPLYDGIASHRLQVWSNDEQTNLFFGFYVNGILQDYAAFSGGRAAGTSFDIVVKIDRTSGVASLWRDRAFRGSLSIPAAFDDVDEMYLNWQGDSSMTDLLVTSGNLGIATFRELFPATGQNLPQGSDDFVLAIEDITLPSSGSIVVLARFVDFDNYTSVAITSDGTLQVYDYVNGSGSTEIVYNQEFNDGDDLVVRFDGTSITAFNEGKILGSGTVPGRSGGHIRPYDYADGDCGAIHCTPIVTNLAGVKA